MKMIMTAKSALVTQSSSLLRNCSLLLHVCFKIFFFLFVVAGIGGTREQCFFLFLICCCRQQRTILFFFSYIVFLYSLFVVARIGMTRERWWKPEALPLYRCTRQDAPQRGQGGTKYYIILPNTRQDALRCTLCQTDSNTGDVLDKIHQRLAGVVTEGSFC